MATAVQNFLYAVETKNWDMVHDLLPGILSNPDIDKRTVLSAIEELYPTVVEDMLYIKMGKQPPKKSRPTVNDDDSDDDLESGDSTSIPQSMSSAQAKTEEQTEEVTELIKILRWKLDEEKNFNGAKFGKSRSSICRAGCCSRKTIRTTTTFGWRKERQWRFRWKKSSQKKEQNCKENKKKKNSEKKKV